MLGIQRVGESGEKDRCNIEEQKPDNVVRGARKDYMKNCGGKFQRANTVIISVGKGWRINCPTTG